MGLVCGLIVLLIVIVTARLRWVERSSVLRSVGLWLATAWTKWGAKLSPATGHKGYQQLCARKSIPKAKAGRKRGRPGR